jgi:hypothetical protein
MAMLPVNLRQDPTVSCAQVLPGRVLNGTFRVYEEHIEGVHMLTLRNTEGFERCIAAPTGDQSPTEAPLASYLLQRVQELAEALLKRGLAGTRIATPFDVEA